MADVSEAWCAKGTVGSPRTVTCTTSRHSRAVIRVAGKILRECGSDATSCPEQASIQVSDRAYLDNTIGAIGLLEGGGPTVPAGDAVREAFMDDDSDDELDSDDEDDSGNEGDSDGEDDSDDEGDSDDEDD